MADLGAPSQLSKFGVYRHGKLVNPQKKLRDRFAHLVEIAGLAETAHVHIGSGFGVDGLPTSIHGANGDQVDPATEEQREAYLFFHHHTHLIFMIYRLYMRSFVMPLSVSQNDLPLVDVTTLLALPPAVATTLSSAASAVPFATIQSQGPTAVIRKLVSDPQIRTIATSVPCFLALSPAFYAYTNVPGLGAPSEGTRNSQMAAARVLTSTEAMNATAVLRQIVLALATDYATLLPFGMPTLNLMQQHKGTLSNNSLSGVSSLLTLPAGPMLLRHQLLLAVIFEVQQLCQPSADYAVRRLGYELLVRIYNFRMAGCIVPTAADRALFVSEASSAPTSIATLEGGQTGTIDLVGSSNPPKPSLPLATAPPNPTVAKAASALVDTETLLRDINFNGKPSTILEADGSSLSTQSSPSHAASFAVLSDDERLLVSLIDWEYFISLYVDNNVRVPEPLKPQRSPNLPDASGALSTDAFSALMPHTYNECLPLNSHSQKNIEIRIGANPQASSSAFISDQPRADRAKESMAMLQLLLDMPMRGAQLARKAILPTTFPYEFASGNGPVSYCVLNTATYRKAAVTVAASLRERWWGLIRRTVVRYLNPNAYFEATYHHEELLAGRGPSSPATVERTVPPNIPHYNEGFRQGPHPLIHPSVMETVHFLYTNGRMLPQSAAPNGGNRAPTSPVVVPEAASRHLAVQIRQATAAMDACLEAEEPYPKQLLPARDALTAYHSQDLRLISLLCIGTLGDAGASPSGDVHDTLTPLACPPRVILRAQSILLDMLKRPAAVCYPSTQPSQTIHMPRIFPLSDYLGLYIEASFLMLATPTIVRNRTPSDTHYESSLRVVTGAPSIPQMFPSTEDDPLDQRMTFLEVLQAAAHVGLPRSQRAFDILTEFRNNAIQAMHNTREQRAQKAKEINQGDVSTQEQTAKSDEGELEAIMTRYLCDPTQSSLYNYRAYYVSEDMSSRQIRGSPMAGLHYLVSTRITQGVANLSTANTAPPNTNGTAVSQPTHPAAPQNITLGDACAQVEALAELFHTIAACDDSNQSSLGLTSATSSFAAPTGSMFQPPLPPYRLIATRVKHAAVHALAAMVAEVTLLSLHSTPTVRTFMADTIAYVNKCLWAACCSKVDNLGINFHARASLSDPIPENSSASSSSSDSDILDYVAAPHDATTFSLLVLPFFQRVLDPALRGVQGNPTTFGGLKACDDTIHSTMGSCFPVPLAYELWGSLVADLVHGNWLAPETRKYLPIFGWGVQAPTAIAPAGTLLGTYRPRRAPIAPDSVKSYVVGANNARSVYSDKRSNNPYRVGHAALAIYFSNIARDSLCVRQHKGDALCALIATMCGRRRNATLEADPSSLNGLTLLAAVLPYVGPLSETRSTKGSLLPIGVEAACRVAELVALPPLQHSDLAAKKANECDPIEASLVLYASAVSCLSAVLPLPPALIRCLERGIRVSMGQTSNISGAGHGPLAWFPQAHTVSESSALAAAAATAIAWAITPVTDVEDVANVLLINSNCSLTDADINTVVAGQRVMQQLCRPNTPTYLGKPTASLVSTDTAFPLYDQRKSVRSALLLPLLEVACLTLLLAPSTKHYDVNADYTVDEKFKYENSYSGPVAHFLVARGDKAIVPAKVTLGSRLFRRALAIYHDLANKKISALLVVEWALCDLMSEETIDTQTISKILTVLEASLHSSGVDFPFASLARVVGKAAALVLSPSAAAIQQGLDPVDFSLVDRVLALSMQLWSDPQTLRKDIRLISVFSSVLDVTAHGIVALFKLKIAQNSDSPFRRRLEGVYSSFVSCICAKIFYYNHDQTWGVDPKMIHSNVPPPSSAPGHRGPSANPQTPNNGRQSPPQAEGETSALSQQKKRYSVARQSIATSSASTALVDATAAFILVSIRITESIQHLHLPSTFPPAAHYQPPTLRQLMIDVVHLLHYGQTSIDYWVRPEDLGSPLLALKHKPLSFQAHELVCPQGVVATTEEGFKLDEALGAIRGTLLQHLQQTADGARKIGEELLRLGEAKLGKKPRAPSPPNASAVPSSPHRPPSMSHSASPAPASHPWLYVGAAKRTIAIKNIDVGQTSNNSPTRRSKVDTESPYGRCLAAIRAVLQEAWVIIERTEGDGTKIGAISLSGNVAANFEGATKVSLIGAFREAERLLAELTAETVKAAGLGGNAATSPTDSSATNFLGVSIVAVPGRPCIMTPWVHLTTSPTAPSYLLQRLHGSSHSFVEAGRPLDVALRQVYTLIDEAVNSQASSERKVSSTPPQVTLSTALCRGPLVIHCVGALLQRSIECRSGHPIPSNLLCMGMSSAHSITVLKGDQRLSSDSVTIIGTDAGDSNALRIVRANGSGAVAFSLTSAREPKIPIASTTPAHQAAPIVPVRIAPAKPQGRLDDLLADFNKGLFVPLAAAAATEKAALAKAAEEVNEKVEEIVSKRRGMSVYVSSQAAEDNADSQSAALGNEEVDDHDAFSEQPTSNSALALQKSVALLSNEVGGILGTDTIERHRHSSSSHLLTVAPAATTGSLPTSVAVSSEEQESNAKQYAADLAARRAAYLTYAPIAKPFNNPSAPHAHKTFDYLATTLQHAFLAPSEITSAYSHSMISTVATTHQPLPMRAFIPSIEANKETPSLAPSDTKESQSSDTGAKVWTLRQRVLVIDASTSQTSLCPQLVPTIAAAATSTMGSAASTSFDNASSAPITTGGLGTAVVVIERKAGTGEELYTMVASAVGSALIIILCDEFGLIEGLARRFGKEQSSTIIFLQPTTERCNENEDFSQMPTHVLLHLFRTGLGAHMAPLQDGMLVPLGSDAASSPLAALLRSVVAGVASRSSVTQFTVGNAVPLEFTAAFPTALRCAAAADLHITCVADSLAPYLS